MSRNIIASLRKNNQLHGSLLLAAIELAHRAGGRSGQVSISYSFLAVKCHQSRRTAIRHIQRLLELKIIARQRFWRPGNKWGINQYRFLIHWERDTTRLSINDTMTPMFPTQREEEEKYSSFIEVEKGKKLVLSWLSPGSKLWEMASSI